MKICLLCIGKTDEEFVKLGIENYTKRLKHYINFELIVIPDSRNAENISQEQQKVKEGELLLKQLSRNDVVILLDERGKEFRSIDVSRFCVQKMIASVQRLVFTIGVLYGCSSWCYQRANL